MNIGPQSCVVRQIPTRIIGIFVDDDRIGSPQPAGYVRIVERSDAPIVIVEPEPLAVATLEVKYVARSKATGKVAVFKRMVQVKACVVSRDVVADPFTVGVDVRRIGMAWHIPEIVLLDGLFAAAMLLISRRPRRLLLALAMLLLGWGPHRLRTMLRYETSAHPAATPAFMIALSVHRKRGHHQSCRSKNNRFLHCNRSPQNIDRDVSRIVSEAIALTADKTKALAKKRPPSAFRHYQESCAIAQRW